MRSQPKKALKRTAAARLIRILAFIVPAAAAFVSVLYLLRWGRPFSDNADYWQWVITALFMSVIISSAVGVLMRGVFRVTRLHDMASNFEEELDSRFRTSLRAGNTRTMLKTGKVELTHQEQVEHAIGLLHRLNRHERGTRGHSERVRAYSTMIGEELRLSDDDLRDLTWAAVLHDVGKMDVPAFILTKVDRPSVAEWAVLKQHPSNARKYLEPLEAWLGPRVYDAALFHHEWWDGTGYPSGRSGADIPLFGRIVSVADAFDVMTHSRSYKKPFPIEHAKQELAKGASAQFDPAIVAAFLRIGEADLAAVRGWSATVAGVSVAVESNLVTIGAQVVIVAASVAAGTVASDVSPPTPPPAIAFTSSSTTTVTSAPSTVAPTTSTTVASTQTSATSTSTTTTEKPIELMSLGYQIETIDQEGVASTVAADRLDVYLDGELEQVLDLNGERTLTIIFDVTDLAYGVHTVVLDLYDGETLVSTEQVPILR